MLLQRTQLYSMPWSAVGGAVYFELTKHAQHRAIALLHFCACRYPKLRSKHSSTLICASVMHIRTLDKCDVGFEMLPVGTQMLVKSPLWVNTTQICLIAAVTGFLTNQM